jgi:hypothetical protein
MQLRNMLPAILLVVGLVAGFSGGSVLRPVTVTETSTTTQPVTTTQKQTIRETLTQTSTTTSISTYTVRETWLRTSTATYRTTETSTVTTTYRITETTTQTATVTTIMFLTVYPAQSGTVLVTDRGSGNKETRPFTLERASDLKITIRITATAALEYVGLSWYLYNVGSEDFFKHGSIRGEQGVFEFYAASVPAGNWYFQILAANCNWEIRVEKVT